MTLEEIYILVQFISENISPGKKLSIDQLNVILKAVDYDLFSDIYGNVREDGGWETEIQISDDLNPFKVQSQISLTENIGDLPDNYFRWGRAQIYYSSSYIPVYKLSAKEVERRLINPITKPSINHPFCELINNKIHVYPKDVTISNIILLYLKRPTHAVYVLKNENGIDVYDSVNSIQPEWLPQRHIDYIRHILKYIGISVNNQQIVNYIEQKQHQL